MVAEDYAPFDVDVTTEDPGTAGLVRSSSGDTVYGTRVLVTPSDDPFAKICARGCGGVAYIGVFDRCRVRTTSPPGCFRRRWATTPRTSPRRPPTRRATTSASTTTAPLRWATTPGTGSGRRSWASATTARWCSGARAPTPAPTTSRTTSRILTGYLGPRPDEAAGAVATPSTLPDGEAVIGTPDDVDAYLLGTCAAGHRGGGAPRRGGPQPRRPCGRSSTPTASSGPSRSPRSGFVDGTTASGLGGSLTVPDGRRRLGRSRSRASARAPGRAGVRRLRQPGCLHGERARLRRRGRRRRAERAGRRRGRQRRHRPPHPHLVGPAARGTGRSPATSSPAPGRRPPRRSAPTPAATPSPG